MGPAIQAENSLARGLCPGEVFCRSLPCLAASNLLSPALQLRDNVIRQCGCIFARITQIRRHKIHRALYHSFNRLIRICKSSVVEAEHTIFRNWRPVLGCSEVRNFFRKRHPAALTSLFLVHHGRYLISRTQRAAISSTSRAMIFDQSVCLSRLKTPKTLPFRSIFEFQKCIFRGVKIDVVQIVGRTTDDTP